MNNRRLLIVNYEFPPLGGGAGNSDIQSSAIVGTPIDYLDFASPESGLGGNIGLDATNKWPPETKRDWGEKIRMSDEIVDRVTGKWASYGLSGSGKPIWK